MVVGWGIVEDRMFKTKQNQEEVVGKDAYGFWESEVQVSSRRKESASTAESLET